MAKKTTDRQRFERCVARVGYNLARMVGIPDAHAPYVREETNEAWSIWQAALRSERRKGKR